METPPTRWIVTGGTGFLGTNFLHALRPEDGEVVVISRRPPQWPVVRPGIRYLEQDIRDVDAYAHEIIPGSIVVHMANSSYPGKAEKIIESDIQDNILGTTRLAQVCAEKNVRSFLFISSGGAIYGNQAVLPIREEAACVPISAYGAMKLTIEHYLRIIHNLRDLPVASLRIGNPFGPWHKSSGQGAINVFMHNIANGHPLEIWGRGEQTRDYIPVQDAVEAIRRVGLEFSSGCETLNIGTGVGRSLKDILADIERVTGRTVPVQYHEPRRVDVASNVLDTSKIRSVYSWESKTPFDQALRETWEWTTRTDPS